MPFFGSGTTTGAGRCGRIAPPLALAGTEPDGLIRLLCRLALPLVLAGTEPDGLLRLSRRLSASTGSAEAIIKISTP